MGVFGITDQGFVQKRLADILADLRDDLSTVYDPATGEHLTVDLADENDPLVQIVNSVADALSVGWEQLGAVYNQFNPLASSGVMLKGAVQFNGFVAAADENDNQIRLRQQQSTSLTSFRHVDAIYSGVVAVAGVTFCKVNCNHLLTPDSRGLPGKSVSCVVVGGDDQSVADAIFGKAALGLEYYGNTELTCTDGQGNPYLVSFERPTKVPIKIAIGITIRDYLSWPVDGFDRIKNALVEYSQYGLDPAIGLPPGAPIITSALYTPINTVPGMSVKTIALSRTEAPPTEIELLGLAWNEVAEIDAANIEVTII